MTGKELKKLSRGELLELLVEQSKRLQAVQAEADAREQALQDELTVLRQQLEERTLKAAECGSIAEASLQVSGIFSAAQAAADTYLQSAREHCAAAEAAEQSCRAEAEDRVAGIISGAEARAAEIISQAESRAAEMLAVADEKLRSAEVLADELAKDAAVAAAKAYARAQRLSGAQQTAEN